MLTSAVHYEKQLAINPTLANTRCLMEEPKWHLIQAIDSFIPIGTRKCAMCEKGIVREGGTPFRIPLGVHQ